jgi:hypothetical protein
LTNPGTTAGRFSLRFQKPVTIVSLWRRRFLPQDVGFPVFGVRKPLLEAVFLFVGLAGARGGQFLPAFVKNTRTARFHGFIARFSPNAPKKPP